ncbi:MAG TPA: MotA/TolQ/ExbB proton channel family protein [Candidatus Saccharimonadales bacterium]|nr:MotA/TolQ/ExbB proton channel family protein [Candidatus Saccharimonadales bacterium]
MKRILMPLIFIVLLLVSIAVYVYVVPDLVRRGGPLVALLIYLAMLSIAFVIERTLTLRKAQGAAPLPQFITRVKKELLTGNLEGAMGVCDKQRGSAANVLKAGLVRYKQCIQERLPKEKIVPETQQAIQEANALEVPLLERNLVALSTIASICTMVGLLGTVIGMIRCFAAASNVGAVDATELAKGISEALINTAGGLFVAIFSIVLYNVFTTRVDGFNYMMDEASYETLQLLTSQVADSK